MKIPIEIRSAIPDDLNFIVDSWVKSHRKSFQTTNISDRIYYDNYRRLIKDCLNNTTTLLAVNPEDIDQIFSFIQFERIQEVLIIHYIYTKASYQKCKVATRLIQHLIDADHPTQIIHTHENLIASKPLIATFNSVFNPYLFYI